MAAGVAGSSTRAADARGELASSASSATAAPSIRERVVDAMLGVDRLLCGCMWMQLLEFMSKSGLGKQQGTSWGWMRQTATAAAFERPGGARTTDCSAAPVAAQASEPAHTLLLRCSRSPPSVAAWLLDSVFSRADQQQRVQQQKHCAPVGLWGRQDDLVDDMRSKQDFKIQYVRFQAF
jgi:hypothetical protein